MAHMAKIENDVVTNVVVVSDANCIGDTLEESDRIGTIFLNKLGLEGTWKRTSYNNKFRKNFAGIGYTFENDMYIPPKPFPSWILNENYDWVSPIPYPNDDKEYIWNEENLNWLLVE